MTDDQKYVWTFCAVGLVAAAYETWRTGYRGAVFIFIVIGGTLLLGFVGVFLLALLVPPKYKRVQGKAFDNKLTLFPTDKSDTNKKTGLQ